MTEVDYRKLYPTFFKMYEQWKKEYHQALTEAGEEAGKRARPGMISYVKKEYRKIYGETIKEFYEDYTPNRYDRHESLYDMLEFIVTEDDDSGMTLSFHYDESKMTPFRSGYQSVEDGLFSYVFLHGYHGGAPYRSSSLRKALTFGGNTASAGDASSYTSKHYYGFGTMSRVASKAKKSPYDALGDVVESEINAPGSRFQEEWSRRVREQFDIVCKERGL